MVEEAESTSINAYKFKIVLVGAQGVGKTSLIRRFAENTFKGDYTSTVGTDITVKRVEISFGLISYSNALMIWDLAGQPRFETVQEGFVKGSHAAMVVAAQDDPATFYGSEGDKFSKVMGVKDWIELINQDQRRPTILLVNKADLSDNQIPDEDIIQMCKETEILGAYRTSAKDGLNVAKVFNTLAGMPLILTKLRYLRHW